MGDSIGMTVRRFIDAEEMHGKNVHRLDTTLEMLRHLKCGRGNYHAQLLAQYMGQKGDYAYGDLEKMIPIISENAEIEMFESHFNLGKKRGEETLWIGYEINKPDEYTL